MSDYQALVAYFGVTFIIFVGGLLWHKYRTFVKRKFPLINYYDKDEENDSATRTGSPKTTHTHA